DFLSRAAAAVLDFLAMALNGTCKTMLSSVQTSEWVVGVALALAVALLVATRGRSIGGFALLLLTVVSGAWLAFKTGHTGGAVQLVALAVLSLHSLLNGRGWALVRGAAK
ncbi:MAG: hypothetical protein NTZ64_00970, partial [Polaromonas sp.]|nr:hypothetical protein [Polaromonas sp.]